MEHLAQGVHRFREIVFRSEKELYERLAQGQDPDTLFITCSDSRISPTRLTMCRPGELFVVRNAGNIIPPWDPGAPVGGEAATVEFAVQGLGVRDIIVCGHSHCGAMAAILDPAKLKSMPLVARWLEHSAETRRIVADRYGHLSGDALIEMTIAENVLVQLEHLETHPSVAAALVEGRLRLHGWVYVFETGEVLAFDRERFDFVPMSDLYPPEKPPPTRAAKARDI